jgi:hypothetical protein
MVDALSSSPSRLSRGGAALAVVLAVVVPVLGGYLYAHNTASLPGTTIVSIELGGGARPASTVAGLGPAVRGSLPWDLLLIATYALSLGLGSWLLLTVSRSATARRWARFGLFGAAVMVLADLVEDAGLAWAFRAGAPVASAARGFDIASVAAVLKFSASVPAVLIAVVGVALTAARLGSPPRHGEVGPDQRRRALPVLPGDPAAGTGDPAAQERVRWWRGYNVPACGHPHAGIHGQPTGICLSGGGIRAASVAMGALQAPRFRKDVVPAAQYLVSVSGGGYTAGAFQQALTGARADGALADGEQSTADAATAFLPGTAEEDHVRRHSSYLASTNLELLVALALLARHLLLTLVLLFGPAVLIGVGLGVFYRAVPVTTLDVLATSAATSKGGPPGFPVPRTSAWEAFAILVVLAVAVWLVQQLAAAHGSSTVWAPVRRIAGAGAGLLVALTVVAAGVILAVPTVVWLSAWLLHKTGGTTQVASPLIGVLLAYGASVASVGWRNRKTITDAATGAKLPKSAPRGVVQLGLVMVTLVVLAAGWLLLVGSTATVGLRPLTTQTVVVLGVLAAVVVFLGGFTDETTLSLHPFYRSKVASAFAVRRVQRTDEQTVARPYAAEERTELATYGALPKGTAFPHVVFAASATVGEKRTAPGAQRVSYTFCSDWVGGPDLGYLATDRMKDLAPPRLQRDLTVQGAVALSGAAIAASVGGQRTAWYETLFVVTGLRLGAWMPNPAYLIDAFSGATPWFEPGLPRARRLSYLMRQLFGAHSAATPLVQVTDGGFYDNLGLVELFRRGVTRIYCIDASGDSPPAATTLAQALTVAQQELGVHTTLDKDTWQTFTAGGADPLDPTSPLAALSARLAQRGIITGTFNYPPGSPFADRGTGVLVVAKASLWRDLDYPLLAYAHNQAVFPRDSTGDQFFDDRQYAAYTALGRALGEAAAAAMDAYREDGTPTVPPSPPVSPRAEPPFIPSQATAGMNGGGRLRRRARPAGRRSGRS